MTEENKKLDQKATDGISPAYEGGSNGLPYTVTRTTEDEYKVGHNAPPMFLVVLYILVLVWSAISWIPFYGY